MNRTKECARHCVCVRPYVRAYEQRERMRVSAFKDKRKRRIYVIEIGAFIFVPCILREHGGTRANPSRSTISAKIRTRLARGPRQTLRHDARTFLRVGAACASCRSASAHVSSTRKYMCMMCWMLRVRV